MHAYGIYTRLLLGQGLMDDLDSEPLVSTINKKIEGSALPTPCARRNYMGAPPRGKQQE